MILIKIPGTAVAVSYTHLREKGIKVGILRPITLWPFPTKAIVAYADKVKGMLVTELNAGQIIEDVRLAVNGTVKEYGHFYLVDVTAMNAAAVSYTHLFRSSVCSE